MAIKVDYSPLNLLLNGASQAGQLQGLGEVADQNRADAANGIQQALQMAQFNAQLQQQRDLAASKQTSDRSAQQFGNEQQAMTGGYYRKQDDVNVTDANTAKNDLAKSQVKRNTAQAMLDEFKATQATAKQQAATPVAGKPVKADNSANEFEFKKLGAAEKAYQSDFNRDQKELARLNKEDSDAALTGAPVKNAAAIAEATKRIEEAAQSLKTIRDQRMALTPAQAAASGGAAQTAAPSGSPQWTTDMAGNKVLANDVPTPQGPQFDMNTADPSQALPVKQWQGATVKALQADPALGVGVRQFAEASYNANPAIAKGDPANGIPPKTLQEYVAGIQQGLGTQGPLDRAGAAELLKAAGGDPKKAEVLAIFYGFAPN